MNEEGVPIIYHLLRQARDRKIKYNQNDLNNNLIEVRYSTKLPDRDVRSMNKTKLAFKYW